MVKPQIVDWTANLARLQDLIASDPSDRRLGESAEARARCFLERLAHQVERFVPSRLRDRLQPDAIAALLAERIASFREGEGRFEAWCHVVLRHHAYDLRHRSRDALDLPRTVSMAPGEEFAAASTELGDGEAGDSARSKLSRELRSMRRALDEITWDPGPARRVDYFAVLLMQLRWACHVQLRGALPSRDWVVFEARTWSKLIETCLPWNAGECDRSFRPGWPPLAQTWSMISETLDQAGCLTFDEFHSILAAEGSEMKTLTSDQWHQWVKRAKDEARARIDPADWDRLFGRLLPDRPRRGGPKGRRGGEGGE